MDLAGDDPWAGYAHLVVEIVRDPDARLLVRVDPTGRVGSWPWDSPEPVHILTAWDPGDERPGEAANQARQAMLESELAVAAAAHWPARGTDPRTGEHDAGVAVRGLTIEQVRVFGARYGQEAVFEWTPARWAIVGCQDSRRVAFGWGLDVRRAT